MDRSKRIRNSNWSEAEKKVLRMLVLERAHIIEKKDTSIQTNAAKKLAWEEVLSSFNAVSSNKRDFKQLLNQWRNMKNHVKKTYRRATSTTNGEPPPPSPPAEDREILEAITHNLTVDNNQYDSDSFYEKQNPSPTMPTAAHCSTPVSSSQQIEPMDFLALQASDETPAPVVLTETEMKTPRPLVRPQAITNKKKKKKKFDCCCRESHDHQLFTLAKKAKEAAMNREEEAHAWRMMEERDLHERKMNIISMEEEYWKAKIMQLKSNGNGG